MKLASLKEGGRDGTLIVVSRDLSRAVRASGIASTLQAALEDWQNAAPRLAALAEALEQGQAEGMFPLEMERLAAPLPRAYEFLDGSAYLPHVERVRRARGAAVPESFYTDPLMYQATSAGFYGPRDPIVVPSEDFGIDLEAEVVVITDDVPMGALARSGRAAHPAHRAGQRRLSAQPDPGRAGEGFRLPGLQAPLCPLAGIPHARRARGGMARRQGAPPLLSFVNGQTARSPGSRRGHAVFLP